MATPLPADKLLSALKAEGLVVHEYKSWRTHNRNSHGAFGPLNGVMLHHTAGLNGMVDFCYNGSPALPGPLCHGVIDKKGEVWLISAGRANHAGGGDPRVLAAVVGENYGATPPATHEHQGSSGAVDGNSHFYGFECVNKGDGKDPWPSEQANSMIRASTALCRAHKWGSKSVIGHLEWSDWKSDPKGGPTMTRYRELIKECLSFPPGKWIGLAESPPPAPAPKPKPTPAPALTVEQRLTRLEKKVGLA